VSVELVGCASEAGEGMGQMESVLVDEVLSGVSFLVRASLPRLMFSSPSPLPSPPGEGTACGPAFLSCDSGATASEAGGGDEMGLTCSVVRGESSMEGRCDASSGAGGGALSACSGSGDGSGSDGAEAGFLASEFSVGGGGKSVGTS
jgi:hypothetical protein